MARTGCVPFVPDEGGPAEIVDRPELCYSDVDDAVSKIARVLRDDDRAREMSEHVKKASWWFSEGTFMEKFRRVVKEMSEC